MSIWVVRGGGHGEFEQKFLQEKRVYVTWDYLDVDLARLPNRQALFAAFEARYEEAKPKTITNWVGQVWPFAHEMQPGNLVIVPLKTQPSIYVGKIAGEYHFEPDGPAPYYHWRPVTWIGEAVPRTRFGQDLLYSFGAYLTIFRVQRNNAEARIRAMMANGWKAEVPESQVQLVTDGTVAEEPQTTDLEVLARDQIAQLISARFKGHGLARLVEAILKAQGYATYLSPEGPDGGIDILAGTGALGFGSPRLCVQVKSQDAPVASNVLNELKGAMQGVNATEGLLVSWGGYKSSVIKQATASFFSVRLWTQKELLEALFDHYDQLGDDLKAELPLKRIWTVAAQDDS